jgi:hypothetical protein
VKTYQGSIPLPSSQHTREDIFNSVQNLYFKVINVKQTMTTQRARENPLYFLLPSEEA